MSCLMELMTSCSLANVDPIDVARNITGLCPETTLGNCQIVMDRFFISYVHLEGLLILVLFYVQLL